MYENSDFIEKWSENSITRSKTAKFSACGELRHVDWYQNYIIVLKNAARRAAIFLGVFFNMYDKNQNKNPAIARRDFVFETLKIDDVRLSVCLSRSSSVSSSISGIVSYSRPLKGKVISAPKAFNSITWSPSPFCRAEAEGTMTSKRPKWNPSSDDVNDASSSSSCFV